MAFELTPEHIALHRLGAGAAPGELDAAAGDPRGYVEQQIDPSRLPDTGHILPDYPDYDDLWQAREHVRLSLRAAEDTGDQDAVKALTEKRNALRAAADNVQFEVMDCLVNDAPPFVAKMAFHWENVFACSGRGRHNVTGLLLRDAILPNLFGSYRDLLKACTTHPEMFLFLNNDQNVDGALNENHPREFLQIHSLGNGTALDPHYTQDDVLMQARAMSGIGSGPADIFLTGAKNPRTSTPGPYAYSFMEGDFDSLDGVIEAVAGHPLTARTQCARLLMGVTGAVEEDDLGKLVSVWIDTEGDLAEVYRALAGLASVWESPSRQYTSCRESFYKIARMVGFRADGAPRWLFDDFPGVCSNFTTPFGISERPAVRRGASALLQKKALLEKLSRRQDAAVDPSDVPEMAAACLRCTGAAELVALLKDMSRTGEQITALALSPQVNKI